MGRACFSVLSDNFSASSTTRSCLSQCRGEPLPFDSIFSQFYFTFIFQTVAVQKSDGKVIPNSTCSFGYQSNHDLQTITFVRVEITASLVELAGRVSFSTSRF